MQPNTIRSTLCRRIFAAAASVLLIAVAHAQIITEFDTLPTPDLTLTAITAGPDGNVWYTKSSYSPPSGRIGRITPTGVVTEFDAGAGIEPVSIKAGADGNLWFAILSTKA